MWQCRKALARAKQVLRQLTEQWSVLETMTPSDYMGFRELLGPSSGFQSLQYRTIEFMLNKNAAMLKVFAHDPDGQAGLAAVLDAPSLYDEFLLYLARFGHPVPAARTPPATGASRTCSTRSWCRCSRGSTRTPTATGANTSVRGLRRPGKPVPAVALPAHARGAADHRLQARHRRFQRRGFPAPVLELSFFPELFDVRTTLEPRTAG